MEILVNGKRRAVDAGGQQSLLWGLRDELDLTGSKYGCGEGQCGACTVLVNGAALRSCQAKLASVADKEITTVEGLADGEHLHPVQQAFVDCDALQCGYCTPGMVVSAVALLRRNPNPSDAEIRTAMQGNICRCGTYNRITAAIHQAAKLMATAHKDVVRKAI